MNRNALLLAGAGAIVVVGFALLDGVTPNTKMIVAAHERANDGGIIYVEHVVTSDDSGVLLFDAGGRLVIGELEIKPCAQDQNLCTDGGSREPTLPCVIPIDATCRRTPPGRDAGRSFGANVFRRGEASGNCRPVPCVVLAGDRAP